jgi:hypothetical protein
MKTSELIRRRRENLLEEDNSKLFYILDWINEELSFVKKEIKKTDTVQIRRFHYLQGQENILEKLKRKINEII